MTCSEWQNKGTYHSVLDHNIFVIDTGGNFKTTIVILHGYPTSSYDFYKVLKPLSKKYRIVLHDHLGFGFSDKPSYEKYSLKTQASIAEKLWLKLNLQNIIVLAHDYGTSVATELIARQNENKLNIDFKGVILCNGSVHIELAKLRPIQKILKSKISGRFVAFFASQKTFSRNMKSIFYTPSKLTKDEIENMWYLLIQNNGKKVLPKITRYINERYTYWDRWIGALKKTNLTIALLWATEDPVAVKAIASQLDIDIKNSRLSWLEKTGHYPMLENPELWTTLVINAIKSISDYPLE
ncbi:MAG: alpha/beta hydrolase [Flavobacteriaceae bacterium]